MSTLGAAITARLPYLRAQAESMMTDSCTITRQSGPATINGAGVYTSPTPTPVYTGKCRVRTKVARAHLSDAAGTEVILWPYIVFLPASMTDIKVLDVVTVTASADAALVGRSMRVQIAHLATNATARRLECEEIA